MKKIYLYILFSILSIEIFSQQDPQFAQNADNLLFTNPAFAGMTEGICASAINRQQWVGFEGAPVTTMAGVHTGVKLFGIKGGIGLSIVDDRFEFEKKFQAKVAFSYHKKVGLGTLGIGVESGIINNDLNGNWKYPDPNGSEDQLIPQGQVRKIVLDLGLGVFYKVGERFYAGVSVSHINQPDINYPKVAAASFLRRHYYATAGYNFRLMNSPIELQPSVFIKFDGTKMQSSANITALYNKKFSVGVSYRNREAFIPMVGVRLLNGLKIGYAYEIPLTRMISVSKGSHEVFVGYCFDFWGANTNYKYKSILYL
ncbi:MAG: type IX secretion system membrane protein PorP/SprF [Bacteroidales bacterium]|nr:type IX secretion system membrane protein PorP/SprF [Bacteroidales bacterium]